MTITHGLSDYQVFQRDADNRATLTFGGESQAEGTVWLQVKKGDRVLQGFRWQKAGTARAGHWEASLKGLPVGGEYRIEVQVRDQKGKALDQAGVDHVLVGDLWVLAGQSNMQGVGDLVNVEEPSPMVHIYEMRGVWSVAKEPLHWLMESPDPVHWSGVKPEDRPKAIENERKNRTKGAGLGLSFAKTMVEATGVPIGLIPCAHGGTSMQQWNPDLKPQGGNSLYGSMLRQVWAAGGKVAGVLWYQGESDAGGDAPKVYLERLKKLVAAIREDFGQPQLPFIYVQIGRFVVNEASVEGWNAIRDLQRQVVELIPYSAVTTAIDLSLDDLIHISTPGLKQLGRRMAKLALQLRFGNRQLAPGPLFERAFVEGTDRTLVRVYFKGVNGRLLPERHVAGFSLRSKEGQDLMLIYEAMPDPARPNTVLLKLRAPLPDDAMLWYGYGLDPYCNLVDAEGMAALAFGPVKVGGS